MGKKKNKKTANKPTTNRFWSQIGQIPATFKTNNNPNRPRQNIPIEPSPQLTKTEQFESEVLELDNGENTSESIIKTNQIPPESDSIFWNEDVNRGDMDFTKDPENVSSNINNEQNQYKQTPTASGSGNSEAGNPQKSVVQGLASKIMFVVQDSKKTVELSSTSDKPQGGKKIEPRITRLKTKTAEQQQDNVLKAMLNAQAIIKSTQPKESTPPAPAPLKKKGNWKPDFVGYSYHDSYYPKGIPRSFYVNPSSQTPEPYSQYASQPQHNQNTPQWQAVNTQTNNDPIWQHPPYPTNQFSNQPTATSSQTVNEINYPQAYSPSDIYTENFASGTQNDKDEDQLEEDELELDSSELDPGQKRQSAFDRLGPVSQPKKPKLTINLLLNKDQAIREVVDETTNEPEKVKYTPVHLREEISKSTDQTVVKYREVWPWKKNVGIIKSVTARTSKTVMMLEKEKMEEYYNKNNIFFQISVKGYPPTWTKENVLDTLFDALNTTQIHRLIPTFIEFTPEECKFLVLRSQSTLLAIHKANFCVRKEGIEMTISISMTALTLSHIEFIPKLILRKRLSMVYDGETVDLSNFTTKEDISHFIYFPLNQSANQMEVVQIQSGIEWNYVTKLILSHNRITCIDGFHLTEYTPKLRHLDLSHNYIEKVLSLINIRDLPLYAIKLEGNPLCNDYIDPEHYVKVLKTMFSSLQEIDGIPIKLNGEMPTFKKNYCPEDAMPIVDKFLEVYFPLLEATDDDRIGMEELYHERGSMTITYRFKLRYSHIYRAFRSLFFRSRVIDEGDTETVIGAKEIVKLIDKWPPLKHDPSTFTIDVLYHDDFTSIFKVAGILKLTSEILAEEEHLLAFGRTFVLQSNDACQFKITNEMIYWDVPTPESAKNSFQITRTLKPKKLSIILESAPEEDLKEGLLRIFMQLTDLNKSASERCLEQKNWNLKMALDYFMKLLKLDDLYTLTKEIKTDSSN